MKGDRTQPEVKKKKKKGKTSWPTMWSNGTASKVVYPRLSAHTQCWPPRDRTSGPQFRLGEICGAQQGVRGCEALPFPLPSINGDMPSAPLNQPSSVPLLWKTQVFLGGVFFFSLTVAKG